MSSYESIATVSGDGSATTLTFSSISSSYAHLQIRGVGRTNRTGVTNDGIFIYFNGDTTDANYTSYVLDGTGDGGTGSAGVVLGNGGVYNRIFVGTGNDAQANTFGSVVVDILDYRKTNKIKSMRSIGGWDLNGSGGVRACTGLWFNTNAITSITIANNNASAFNSNTKFSLYGIKDS